MKEPPGHLEISARLLFEEAGRRGIDCTFLGDERTIFMEKDGVTWYTRGSRTSLQSSVGLSIADNKLVTKRLLRFFGLPTSNFALVESEAQLEQLEQLAYPLVIKPLDLKQGVGVVVGLEDAAAAREQFVALNRPALFEEMLHGTEYRVLCVDYKCLAVAMRHPAHVVGDGERSIEALVEEKNNHPWRSDGHVSYLTRIKIDAAVEKLLKRQGFALDSVPPKGVEVMLRKTGNLSTGGEAWDVTAQVSDENLALFEEIARRCDLNTVGIDVMCSSLEQPIASQAGAGVIEVNASPGLRMHHFPTQGERRNIAGAILDMAERHYFP